MDTAVFYNRVIAGETNVSYKNMVFIKCRFVAWCLGGMEFDDCQFYECSGDIRGKVQSKAYMRDCYIENCPDLDLESVTFVGGAINKIGRLGNSHLIGVPNVDIRNTAIVKNVVVDNSIVYGNTWHEDDIFFANSKFVNQYAQLTTYN